MTRACLAVAAPSAKKGGAASKIKKTTLDSKKAKRSAALPRVRQALDPQPRVPPGVAAKGAPGVAERPGLAGPHCDRSYRLCASRPIANP